MRHSPQQGQRMTHGSHLQHPFKRIAAISGTSCTICHAESRSSLDWFICVDPNCNFLLCHKCFEIEECLFDSPQVVIRNPAMPLKDNTSFVFTRPRTNSHKLAPIYYGQLIEIVSSARNSEDETYFRLTSGGWINSKEVVCVIPSDEMVDSLARYHMPGALNPVCVEDLISFMDEGINLTEMNPQYGTVWSYLVMYPLLFYLHQNKGRVPLRNNGTAANLDSVPLSILRFVHYNLEMVLACVEVWIEDEKNFDENVILSLYIDLLSGLLGVCQELVEQWKISLPKEFLNLFLRTFVVLGYTVHALQKYTVDGHVGIPIDKICQPAVVNSHVDKETELNRLGNLARLLIDTNGRLASSCVRHCDLELSQLAAIRQFLNFAQIEQLEKNFCEMLAHIANTNVNNQNSIMNIDPLEVIARLCCRMTLAESQIAIFHAVSSIVRRNSHNCVLVACVLLNDLLKMSFKLRGTNALIAALECFYELAYNDPRTETETENNLQLTPRFHELDGSCARTKYGLKVPFHLMYCFETADNVRVGLCRHCAEHHSPKNSRLVGEPQFAYFVCQCNHARCASPNPQPANPPMVPLSSALAVLCSNPRRADFLRFVHDALVQNSMNESVIDSTARLAFRIEMPTEIIEDIFICLLPLQDLSHVSSACLLINSYTHLPRIQEGIAGRPDALVVKQLRHAQSIAACIAEETQGSQIKSELGLSPSPAGNSTFRSSQSFTEIRGNSMIAVYPQPGELFSSQFHEDL